MQGGLPIVVDGEVIGAIGASFDTPEHDVQIASRVGSGTSLS
jgi:glc operon protein GlcG